jgi:predicted transcriptional regulator
LKLLNQQRPDRLTAFRLPRALLETVDSLCEQQDVTRSQFFRRCIVQFIKRQAVEDERARAER